MESRVYVILVNYNRAVDTIACLRSLEDITETDLRVIVIENGSTDGSDFELRSYLAASMLDGGDSASTARLSTSYTLGETFDFHRVTYIPSMINRGFAGGCNLGIAIAMEDKDCDFVWLLNNDTEVRPSSISAMLDRFLDDDALGICGSTLVYASDTSVIQACGGAFNLFLARGKNIGSYLNISDIPSQSAVESELDYVVGASMLASRRFIEKVGVMDDRYFLFFEELDWALRSRKHGFKLGWAPGSVVAHKEGSSTGSKSQGKPSNIAIHFMSASYLRLVIKHRPLLLPVAIINVLIRSMKWLLKGEFEAAMVVLRATRRVIESPTCSRGLEEMNRQN